MFDGFVARAFARVCSVLSVLCFFPFAAQAAPGLGAYNVNPDTVTVAGLSSGADMAVQLMVANSASFRGAAIMAGAAYYCNQGNVAYWGEVCATGVGVPVSSLVDYTNSQAARGAIDPVANIAGKPIYMFSGTEDTVVYQQTMNDLKQYLQSFTPSVNITYNNSTPAEHAWISPDAVNACNWLGVPFLNNCGIDLEQVFLAKFYGSLYEIGRAHV